MNRAQGTQAPFQAAHVGSVKRTEIENGAGAFRDDIGARTAFDGTGVDGDAAAKIVPFLDASELLSQFVNGVDPFFARKGVGEAELIVHGRASHAGLAPEEGINAIHELAQQLARIEKWNDLRRGVTINAGHVE